MPKRPPVIRPDQRPKTVRVHVADGRHVYTGIGHIAQREGTPLDLPPDHAAELLAGGHVLTPEDYAAKTAPPAPEPTPQ